MKERIKKSLLNLGGSNLQVNESNKSLENKRKKLFLSTIEDFEFIINRSDTVDREFGINLLRYDDAYFRIIEKLIVEHWGDIISEVIFWWVYDVVDPKNEQYHLFQQKTGEKVPIKSPTQLYNTLKKFKLFKPI
tara:strand:+ start:218 stop:619 length:402 start_codon:yes stop_codon:yes gene_type:complete